MEKEELFNHWRKLVNEQSSSGIAVSAWCKERQIKVNTFFYWKKKFRENQDLSAEVSFAELHLLPSVKKSNNDTGFDSQVRILFSGYEIHIGGQASQLQIKTVLETLQKLC